MLVTGVQHRMVPELCKGLAIVQCVQAVLLEVLTACADGIIN